MPLHHEDYARQRDVLVGLLNRTIATVKDLDARHKDLNLGELAKGVDQLSQIARRVYEDQFRIVLVARFQGGKSTTFNAMCDGRVLSPMGNAALKCSAAPIMAYNVTDPASLGAEVFLRTSDELSRLCQEALPGLEVDLDNPSSRKRAIRRHADEVQEWRENRSAWDEGRRDLLFSSGLVLHFYGSNKVAALRRQAAASPTGGISLSFEEIGRIVRFPQDYLKRYQEGDPRVFDRDPDEVLFPFVRRVVCRVASENLRAIGAAVIDCPGLFANRTDTEVTLQEIRGADAVWYLMDARALGEEELRAIKTCHQQCEGRLFFTANLKDGYLSKARVIRDVFSNLVGQLRSDVDEKYGEGDLRPYHALLALLALQGPKVREGSLDEASADAIQRIADDMELGAIKPEEVWSRLADFFVNRLYPGRLNEFERLNPQLSPEGIAIVRRESEFDTILSAIQDFVVRTKGESILVDNGSRRAYNLLHNDIENRLKVREETATTDAEVLRRRFEAAEKQLDEFLADAENELRYLLGENGAAKDRQLAEDLYQKALLDQVDQIARDAAGPLHEATGYLDAMWHALIKLFGSKGTSEMERRCRSILEEAIGQTTELAVSSWTDHLRHGGNELFQRLIVQEAERIVKAINKSWKGSAGDVPMLKDLPAPTMELGELSLFDQMVSIPVGDVAKEAEKAAGEVVARVVKLVVQGIVAAIMLHTVAPVIGAVILVLLALVRDRDAEREKLEAKLRKALAKGLEDGKPKAQEAIASMLADFRKAYVQRLRAPLDKTHTIFRQDKAVAEEHSTKAEAERQRIAAICRKIREEDIAPLRHELGQFTKDTLSMCSD
jgi:hypothetical protein